MIRRLTPICWKIFSTAKDGLILTSSTFYLVASFETSSFYDQNSAGKWDQSKTMQTISHKNRSKRHLKRAWKTRGDLLTRLAQIVAHCLLSKDFFSWFGLVFKLRPRLAGTKHMYNYTICKALCTYALKRHNERKRERERYRERERKREREKDTYMYKFLLLAGTAKRKTLSPWSTPSLKRRSKLACGATIQNFR